MGLMPGVDPSLRLWGWFFLTVYIALMVVFGVIGMRRIRGSDDFATARRSYGPLFLALAFTATTASGGTFIGIPALAYAAGFSALRTF
jgi:Na+/proline symporter